MLDPQRVAIYARGLRSFDPHSRMYVPVFPEASTARAWYDFFIRDETVTRRGNRVFFDSDDQLWLKSDQLDQILAAEPGSLSMDDMRRITRFKHGIWEGVKPDLPSIERAPRPVRDARPACPAGYVTISELCAGSGVLPTHARAMLRAEGMIKPPYGWAFDPKDADKIKQICNIR